MFCGHNNPLRVRYSEEVKERNCELNDSGSGQQKPTWTASEESQQEAQERCGESH
jgi:hypothetical protein